MVGDEGDTTRQFCFEALAAIAFALAWALFSSTAEQTNSKPAAASRAPSKKLQRRAAPGPSAVKATGRARPRVVPLKSEIGTQTPNYMRTCIGVRVASNATSPTAMTWNGFQHATAGRGLSRREAAILWAAYKVGQYELPAPRPAAGKKLRHVKPVAPTTVARSVAPPITKSMLPTDYLIKQLHPEMFALTQNRPST